MRFPSSHNLAFLVAMSLTLGCSSNGSDQNAVPNNSVIDSSSNNTIDVVEATNNSTEPPDTALPDVLNDSAQLTPLVGEPMLFLSNLNGPPYGNLPEVDYSPRLTSLERFPDEAKQRLDGCLYDSYGIGYCYKPENRILSAYLDGGDLFWSFNLPGSNETNRVDELLATSSLHLFTNVTTQFGLPKHEQSSFGSSGRFLGTHKLFELDGEVYPKVNIQGEPLAVGSIFENGIQQICINANTYELIEAGNSANPMDWHHSGAVYLQLSQRPRMDIVEGVLIEHPSTHTVSCGYPGQYSNISLRNSAQNIIERIYQEATDSDLYSAASALIRFANENSLINSQIPCSSASSAIDRCSQLSGVGDSEALEPVEAGCEVFSKYIHSYIPGTVELNTKLERVTETEINVTQEFKFSDYCKTRTGYLSGIGSLESTIDISTGAIIEQVVHFEDLTSTLFNFVGGSYTTDVINGTKTRTLRAESISLLAYCTRSCHPGPFLSAVLEVPRIIDVQETDGARRVTASWVSIPNLGQVSQTEVSLDLIRLAEDDFIGHIEFRKDNDTVRAQTISKAPYPNLQFFQYTLNETDQPATSWDVPVKGFPNSLVYSYSEQANP